MAKYLTWDKKRQRYIYQRRIPTYARANFDNRTHIKEHLGNISEAQAKAIALQLTEYYDKLFTQYKETSQQTLSPPSRNRKVQHYELNNELEARFIATWRTELADLFKKEITSLRKASSDEWSEIENKLYQNIYSARLQIRQHDTTMLYHALSSMEKSFNIKIDYTTEAMDKLVHEFNAAYLDFLRQCMDIVQEGKSVYSLVPESTQQLPLVELWGTTASDITKRWENLRVSNGLDTKAKTIQKYNKIATDLYTLLGRRPVETLSSTDLEAIKTLWKSRGNIVNTIKQKLDILKTLVRPFINNSQLIELFKDVYPQASISSVKRLPFTEGQHKSFIENVLESSNVRQDDKMLLILLSLTGARVEEVYQLRSDDFEKTQDGWIIRFASHHQTGTGDSELKNTDSARRLPIYRGIDAEFDHWLDKRITSEGYIFPHGSTNKHGTRSAAASKRLNRILRKLFPNDKRLVLQSTRKTASRIMRQHKVDPRVRHRTLGHADSGIHDSHYDPGELIDAEELQSGSRAIADHIFNLLNP